MCFLIEPKQKKSIRQTRKLFCILSAFILSSNLGICNEFVKYKFEDGDQTGKVLECLGLAPLWGKNGNVRKTYVLNESFRPENQKKIKSGTVIYLPITKSEVHQYPSAIFKNGFIQIRSRLNGRSDCLNTKSSNHIAATRKISQDNTPEKTQDEKDIQSSSNTFESLKDDVARSYFSFGYTSDYFKIKGTDTNTNGEIAALSDLSPGILLGWNLIWDKETIIILTGTIQRYSIQQLEDTQKIQPTSGIRTGYYAGIQKKIFNNFDLGFGLRINEELFFQSKSATKIFADKIVIIRPQITSRYGFLTKKNSQIGFLAELGVNLPEDSGEYKIKPGYHTLAGLYLRHHSLEDFNKGLEGQIFYSFDKQDTSISTRYVENIGLKFLYHWRIDP